MGGMRWRAFWAILSLVSGVLGQETSNCDVPTDASGTFTIATQSDADRLANCTEYAGNISIRATERAGITLSGIASLTGSLNILNSETIVNSLIVVDLTKIHGALTMENATIYSIEMRSLKSVESLSIANSSTLGSVDFTAGLDTVSTFCEILSNQNLTVLSGLTFEQTYSLDIRGNGLRNLTLGLRDVITPPLWEYTPNFRIASTAIIAGFPVGLDLDMPNLYSIAGIAELQDINHFSAPNLAIITGSFSYACLQVSSVFELPALYEQVPDSTNSSITGFTVDPCELFDVSLPILHSADIVVFGKGATTREYTIKMPLLDKVSTLYIDAAPEISYGEGSDGTLAVDCSQWQLLSCEGHITENLYCNEDATPADNSSILCTRLIDAAQATSSNSTESTHSNGVSPSTLAIIVPLVLGGVGAVVAGFFIIRGKLNLLNLHAPQVRRAPIDGVWRSSQGRYPFEEHELPKYNADVCPPPYVEEARSLGESDGVSTAGVVNISVAEVNHDERRQSLENAAGSAQNMPGNHQSSIAEHDLSEVSNEDTDTTSERAASG